MKLAQEDLNIVDEIGQLGQALWAKSAAVAGLNTDPKMMSVMLFQRLWSNHRGFMLLWRNALQTEADIVLRCGLEAAICIAANHRLRERFVQLARLDMIETLKRQIKMWRDAGSMDMVRDGEALLRDVSAGLAEKPRAFDFKDLANLGGVPLLHTFHRALSGVSSHVTGISLIRGVVGGGLEGKDEQDELAGITRHSHLMMMAGATLIGSKLHAAMIAETLLERTADDLAARMNATSELWFGADDEEP